MGGFDRLGNARVGRDQAFLVGFVPDGAQGALRVGDRPLLGGAVVTEFQVGDAEVVAPESGHHDGFAVDGAFRQVCAGDALVGAAGEFQVAVSAEDHVDAGHGGEGRSEVLHAGRVLGVDAAVREGHDNVRASGFHFGHEFLGGLHGVPGHDLALQPGFVPVDDLRGREADHADVDDGGATAGVVNGVALDDVGRVGVLAGFALAVVAVDVGGHDGHGGLLQHLIQVRQTVVELVVAEGGGVVPEYLHGGVHGVLLPGLQGVDAGHVITERVALDQVAVVEQQGVAFLGAGLVDEGGGVLQAELAGGFVLVVVVPQRTGVQVGGFQDAQVEGLGGPGLCGVGLGGPGLGGLGGGGAEQHGPGQGNEFEFHTLTGYEVLSGGHTGERHGSQVQVT